MKELDELPKPDKIKSAVDISFRVKKFRKI
jgi:hypothetical protein